MTILLPPLRGNFVIVGTGEMCEFMFNPSSITDSMGPNFATQEVPGISFPTQSYGGGRARQVSFELLFSERGSGRFRPRNSVDTRVIQSTDERNPVDLTDDIKFYQSLTQPQNNYAEGRSFEARSPPVLLLNLGSMYQGWPCVLNSLEVTVTKWTKNLEPMEARIPVTLTHKPSLSETRSNYFRGV